MRLMPFTLAVLCLAFLGKVGDVVLEAHSISQRLLIADARAQEEAPKEEEAKKEEADSDTKEAKHGEEPAKEDAHGKKAEKGGKDLKLDTPPEKEEEKPKGPEYSQIEIDLLQSLGQRRQELEERARKLELREQMLKGAEAKVDGKLKELKTLKGELDVALAKYNENEEAKIASLVKIYETMKPKDAGNIFNEMEMEILLRVVDKMSEKKAAPILASMSPERARDITLELANTKRLPEKLPEEAAGSVPSATATSP
jgi:flagellar motility protein MotE (MotC chaperone)